ncbi:hypothetical protein [Puniceibacterium sp. IMCC21224]|uniref:hypothetical protein n=1 Tax=Puniceibacterium sp. IMCC21224 TaxID=1618204 RepID=UPI00064DF1E9|nr:hypothetical protein [Puniceibacterium sp. IMCC21224]KMK67860.1 hypothetical protein IMCC21224_112737 [Puniceibacterium sp. IMCC21224]
MTYTAPTRSWRGCVALITLWTVLVYGYLQFGAEGWIVGTLALFTLPAAWDLCVGRAAGLTLTPETMEWHSGRVRDRVALNDIERVRLDRRFDLSMRVTLVLHDGRKQRLPQDVLPPSDQLQPALAAQGVQTERHPFSLF